MKSCNLVMLVNEYTLLKRDPRLFSELERYESKRDSELKIKTEEIESIQSLIETLIEHSKEIDILKISEGFFYSYSIPQIPKEFDLLKADGNKVVNIEIKSSVVSDEKIITQLKQNRMYLNGANFKHIREYSYMRQADGGFLLRTFSEDKLVKVEVKELIEDLISISVPKDFDLDDVFDPSAYLVSPLNSPERFLNGEYFLTGQQEQIEKKIINSISSLDKNQIFVIKGSAGTGKTLLGYSIGLYLAKELKKQVLIVHCGQVGDNHQQISDRVKQLRIAPIKKITETFDFNKYDVLIIDEAQRIWSKQFELICSYLKQNSLKIVMCYDEKQKLSKTEISFDQLKRIEELKINKVEETLTEKIRTNKKLGNFVKKFFKTKGSDQIENVDLSDVVKVIYVADDKEAKKIAKYYIETIGFKFIPFTPSSRKNKYGLDGLSDISDVDTHSVLGKEYPSVVMALGPQFRVENNNLFCLEHPYSNYSFMQLLFEGITRAQKSIVLIIYDNIDLLNYTLSCIAIKTN